MAQLSGKTALITGASVGLGRELAEHFARDGHSLVLTARNETQLAGLASQLRANHSVNVEVMPEDLSLAGTPQMLFDQTASKNIHIDFLVNNAGFGSHGSFAESDLLQQLAMVQVNVAAVVHLTRLFLPAMLARKSGRIMNIASTAAYVPGPFMSVYYASKAFVLSFSEALDAENAIKGVTVTALCPGATATEFQKRAGINHSALFKNHVMTTESVAKIGYDAMMSGKRVVVTGMRNKILTAASKIGPRRMATAVARRLNENR